MTIVRKEDRNCQEIGFGESHAAANKDTVIKAKKMIGREKKYLQLKMVRTP